MVVTEEENLFVHKVIQDNTQKKTCYAYLCKFSRQIEATVCITTVYIDNNNYYCPWTI